MGKTVEEICAPREEVSQRFNSFIRTCERQIEGKSIGERKVEKGKIRSNREKKKPAWLEKPRLNREERPIPKSG